MESLSDKLRALGIKPGNQVPPPPAREMEDLLPALIPGETVENSQGSCYLSSTEYPLEYQHGCVNFSQSVGLGGLSTLSKNGTGFIIPENNIFYLDTETTGLSGGTGTFAFLVGMGYQIPSGFRVDQYLIRNPMEEPAMLLEVANFVESKNCIATFNGKSFDIPLMNNRYVINRQPIPFDHLNHLDLLHISRRIWKSRLPSRALQDLEREILRIPRDEIEVPGWMIPEIYFEYQKTHDPARLAGVLYHNRMDILSLAALTIYISQVLEEIESGKYQLDPIDLFSIGRIFDDAGFADRAENVFIENIKNPQLEKDQIKEAYHRLGMIYKKKDAWKAAINQFEAAAALNDYESSIELAKYYEHKALDYAEALSWTKTGREQITNLDIPRYKKNGLIKEMNQREKRLVQKMSKDEANGKQLD